MPPSLIVSLMLGSLYGLLFFLLADRTRRGLWAYWLVGAFGFVAGQIIGEYIHISSIALGDVHVIEGSLVSWIGLFLLYNRG